MKIIVALKKSFLILLLLSIYLPSFGQKDAPVAGHAATLVDLLKKNYNAIDPELKEEEVARDRTTVISILKSYLEEGVMENSLTNDKIKAPSQSLESLLAVYNGMKKQLLVYSSNNVQITTTVNGNQTVSNRDFIKEESAKVETARDNYYKARFEVDSQELTRISSLYEKNKFVTDIITSFIAKYKNINDKLIDGAASANYTSSLQKGIPFIGGNVLIEKVLDTLSTVIAARIKAELTTYAVENIKKWLDNPSANDPLEEFKVILPGTTNFLRNFDADRLPSFPNEIRQHISEDLNHVLENAVNIRETTRTRRLIAQNPNLEFVFDGLKIIPVISSIKYPIDYFKLLENSETLKKWEASPNEKQSNLLNSIKLAGLIARSMIIMDNDEPRFAGSTFLGSYASEKSFFHLYAGFLYQQNKKYYDITFYKGNNTKEKISVVFENLVSGASLASAIEIKRKIESTLSSVGTTGEKVYVRALQIRQGRKSNKDLGPDTVFQFVKSIIELSDQVIQSGGSLAAELINDSEIKGRIASTLEQAGVYTKIANIGNEVVLDLKKKQYVIALTKSLNLVSQLAPQTGISDLPITMTNLLNIKTEGNIKDWHTIISSLAASGSGTAKELQGKLGKSIKHLDNEVSNLKYFYLENHKKTDLDYQNVLDGIDQIRKLFFKITEGDEADIDNLQRSVKSFIQHKDFRLLVVSYYTNTAIDKTAERLEIEIKKFNINGDPVFDEQDAGKIKKFLLELGDAMFVNYVENGYKDQKHQILLQAKRNLNLLSSEILFKLPQRTDLTINPRVIKMVNFVNTIASVKNDPESIKKAMDLFMLPTGSYAIKRKSYFNLSVNSYPGVLPALDITWKNGNAYGGKTIGFTAPVGLSFSWGKKNESSHGLFIPIVDVGALTRFRIDKSNTTKALPELTLANVFSPGIYYHYDFNRSPFAILIGGQYGPSLKEVTGDANNVEVSKSYESVRIGIGFVLDIPLFNLHTKAKL